MNYRTITHTFTLATMGLLASCGGGGHDDAKMAEHMAMMKADSSMKATMTTREEGFRAVMGMFDSGNAEGLENYVAENMMDHTPMPGMTSTGMQGLKDMIAMHHAAFPDSKMTILSVAQNGDMLMAHFNMKGTNTGAMGAMPATGKAVDVNGVDVIRFEGDKAVEHWGYMEDQKMMEQMGMMPPPGDMKDKKKM
ncbi:MAG: ester cyclase [Flavobacteriales bacterium]